MEDKAKPSTKNKGAADVILPRSIAKKAKSATPASTTEKNKSIVNTGARLTFESVTRLKQENKTIDAIRLLTNEEALAGFSLFAMTQIADSGIQVMAYENGTAVVSPEASEAVKVIIARLDTLSDYSKGYSDKPMLQSIIHTLLRESPQTGGIAIELVLDKVALPEKIQVVDYATLEWMSDGLGGRWPRQKVKGGGDPIELNIATFFVGELHKESHEVAPTPLLKSSLTASIANNEFIEDMRRAVNKAGHSRLLVTLDAAKVRASAPPEIQSDTGKLAGYMQNVLEETQQEMADLEPDDSLVGYDSATFAVADIGGSKQDYVPLMKAMANYQSTGLKTPPSIIGVRADGSQSLSNSETLVYLKVVRAIQVPIEEVLSRALTLAIRLYGLDAYVRVKFNQIDLRPEGELEAFRVQKQQRYLELLSLGKVTDYEFGLAMGINHNPAAEMLSGTGFYSSTNKTVSPETDDTHAMERTLASDEPKRAGGKSQ